MEMPTLSRIFYDMNGEEVSSPELEDEMYALCGFARSLEKNGKIENADAERLCENANAAAVAAKCAGFTLGFSVAVNLFTRRD